MRIHRLFLFLTFSLAALFVDARLDAQANLFGAPTSPTEPPSITFDTIAGKEQSTLNARNTTESRLAEASEEQSARLREQLQLIERTRLLLGQQRTLLLEIEAATNEAKALEEQQLAANEAEPEISLVELDSLRDELDNAGKRLQTATDSAEAAEAALVQSKKLLASRAAARRKAQADLAENQDAVRFLELQQIVELRKLEDQIASELVILRTLELRRDRILRDNRRAEEEQIRTRIEFLSPHAVLSEEAFRTRADRIRQRAAEIATQLSKAEQSALRAEAAWSSALQGTDANESAVPKHADRISALHREYLTWQQTAKVLNDRLQRLDDIGRVWQRRYNVLTEFAATDEKIQWKNESRGLLTQYEREERIEQSRLSDLREQALVLNERISSLDAGNGLTGALTRQKAALQSRIEVQEVNLTSLTAAIRHHSRLLAELRGAQASPRISERLSTAWLFAKDLWSYEIASVDDQSVTVGKVFIALLLLTVGLRLARTLSSLLSHRVLPRFGVPPAAANVFEAIAYYAAVAGVVLFALNTVSIPLTAFTIVGGALAIGIGFGSQNLVNNFISGLILLMERPVSAGDLVDIDGTLGTIDRIGARSTRLRTFDNTHVLIPNSFFLENRFINWTLSDDVVRGKVTIGVAYGSPVREVQQLLLQATERQPYIHRKRPPWVRFQEFGDNALLFDLLFFVRPHLNVWEVQSDIRYKIAELFAAAGITIAFPQRDVHLDTQSALDVRIVSTKPPEPDD